MLYVRNPTGVSHSPDEWASADDCVAGILALADVVTDLAGGAVTPAPEDPQE
jgi:N-carbamoyl-L-amino-acid hydrolase